MKLVSFQQYLPEYRKQLAKGDIKAAYSGLMKYFDDLRLQLKLHVFLFLPKNIEKSKPENHITFRSRYV
jgi:hypothetical protein